MGRLKNKILIHTVNNSAIRHRFDEKTNQWYFSVVDLTGLVTGSKDPRNYWKVLKNRLKKEQNELVTKINQLKMPSKDGKNYLTDAGDTKTMLELLSVLSPDNLSPFQAYFEDFLSKNIDAGTEMNEDIAELLVDAYETETDIVIRAMIAGVSLGDIYILPMRNKLSIKGNRISPKRDNVIEFLNQELMWSRFERTINLPHQIDVNSLETTEENGMLTIRLRKI